MPDTRLIEQWLPIGALGEESARERRSLQALPPTYYLHAWWARRPLVASRAAILASLLPAHADQDKFLHAIGILGDPVATKKRIDLAKKTKENLGLNPYGYERAFKYLPSQSEREWIRKSVNRIGDEQPVVLDPTAGGGSIPFESVRLGLPTLGNDINPVAVLIEKATLEYPMIHGRAVLEEFRNLARRFTELAEPRFIGLFPIEHDKSQVTGYLWARTITCPYCSGVVPLSPNWRLAPDGRGIRLVPQLGTGPHDSSREVHFEIVDKLADHSPGTVSDGDGMCPYSDCNRQIDGDEIKTQAQAGNMGEVLYAIVVKRPVSKPTKSGRMKESFEKTYRVPNKADDVYGLIRARLDEKIPDWEVMGFIPNEPIPLGLKTEEPRRYGITAWRNMFSARQLFGHCTAVEVFNELLDEANANGQLSDLSKAAFVYLSFSIDKLLNWNAILSSWNVQLESMRSVFDRHDFAFKWTFAEMPPFIVGAGYGWVIEQTDKCLGELIGLVRPDDEKSMQQGSLAFSSYTPTPATLSCKSADSLDHIEESSVDCVVMDPPYYDNVMYAELSDFFYVWLKRTAGRVYPELFRRQLTDKDNEAVANPSKFRGEKGAKALAGRDYQDRMAAIFAECRRVLKPSGIMTLMFTHKATGAWDAITKGLMEAGFTITASWPINTEAGGSLHIKDKAAANSTIFLVCRPRAVPEDGADELYWEDVEPLVAQAVRRNIERFQESGIGGVDLYLASFGPALEEFSKHWPLKRGTPRPKPEELKRKRQSALFDEEFNPYAVSPEDALDAARREVKSWKLEQLTHMKANAELDPATAWFVLAWDAFRATLFAYDEALRLARAVGVDLDTAVIGRLAEKKGSDIRLWDSGIRAAKGALGPADGSRAMIDAIRFRDKQSDVLLCTDAAAEGLNFQFCGALVNYDMPWNPMRVEQRIGRIDRLGQQYPIIKIVNLHYDGTVETDVYCALKTRIGLFTAVVGKLQPILATLSKTIAANVLSGQGNSGGAAQIINVIEVGVDQARQGGFDIDEVTQADLEEPYRPDATLTMDDLDRVIRSQAALPAGVSAGLMSAKQYAYSAPGMGEKIRVTTDPSFYEEHSESVELWSPGSPLFPLDQLETLGQEADYHRIADLLPE